MFFSFALVVFTILLGAAHTASAMGDQLIKKAKQELVKGFEAYDREVRKQLKSQYGDEQNNPEGKVEATLSSGYIFPQWRKQRNRGNKLQRLLMPWVSVEGDGHGGDYQYGDLHELGRHIAYGFWKRIANPAYSETIGELKMGTSDSDRFVVKVPRHSSGGQVYKDEHGIHAQVHIRATANALCFDLAADNILKTKTMMVEAMWADGGKIHTIQIYDQDLQVKTPGLQTDSIATEATSEPEVVDEDLEQQGESTLEDDDEQDSPPHNSGGSIAPELEDLRVEEVSTPPDDDKQYSPHHFPRGSIAPQSEELRVEEFASTLEYGYEKSLPPHQHRSMGSAGLVQASATSRKDNKYIATSFSHKVLSSAYNNPALLVLGSSVIILVGLLFCSKRARRTAFQLVRGCEQHSDSRDQQDVTASTSSGEGIYGALEKGEEVDHEENITVSTTSDEGTYGALEKGEEVGAEISIS
ncbi:unnamed protein product [Amoebophrya sp. A25]|nr:unnamed protein product [Amoebophrya sp. A25]|eukprot:GSA25T00014718001.1